MEQLKMHEKSQKEFVHFYVLSNPLDLRYTSFSK